MNRVFLMGNLTRDPEVRYLPSGSAVTNFDIAINERYRDRNQEMREETLFIRVDTFARQAETCAQYLKKGSKVLVEGKLKEDKWEAKDGTKRSRVVVVGLQVHFVGARAGGAEGGSSAQSAGPAQPAQPAPAAQPAAPSAPIDASPTDGVPEVDINEQGYAEGPEGAKTDDDLPF